MHRYVCLPTAVSSTAYSSISPRGGPPGTLVLTVRVTVPALSSTVYDVGSNHTWTVKDIEFIDTISKICEVFLTVIISDEYISSVFNYLNKRAVHCTQCPIEHLLSFSQRILHYWNGNSRGVGAGFKANIVGCGAIITWSWKR